MHHIVNRVFVMVKFDFAKCSAEWQFVSEHQLNHDNNPNGNDVLEVLLQREKEQIR